MFQVVCDRTFTEDTRPLMIVGQGPFTEQDAVDFGTDYPIFDIEDDAQYEQLAQSGYPWLTTADTIVVTPEMVQPEDVAST